MRRYDPMRARLEAKADLKRHVEHHVMLIEQDVEVFRSVHFATPARLAHSFRLNTWPGHLSISGDCDTFVFQAAHDMFGFFMFAGPEYDRTERINPRYWSEKLVAMPGGADLKEYSPDMMHDWLRARCAEHVKGLNTAGKRRFLAAVDRSPFVRSPEGMTLEEAVEWCTDFQCPASKVSVFRCLREETGAVMEHSHGFLYACHAIQWGIKQHELHRQGRSQAHHSRRVLAGEL
jgi:hypothetical protein